MGLAALGTGGRALARGAHDIRGWRVRTLVDDRVAGTVHELLVTEAGRVRWVVLGLSDGRRVLLPAGQARADRAGGQLWIPGLASDQLAQLPAFDPSSLPDEAAERAALAAYQATLLREPALPPGAEPAGDVAPLAALPELRVARKEPDPRGWPLLGAADERLGRVDELLVDAAALKVRHLVCRLDGPTERLVLLPVRYAHLDARGRNVRVPRLTRAAAGELPAWSPASEPRRAAEEAIARLGELHSLDEDPRLDAAWLYSEEP